MKKRKSILSILVTLIMLCASLIIVQASEPKPSVKLDVRSEKQAILTIEDTKMSQLKQDVSYSIDIGGYTIQLSWCEDGSDESNTAIGSLLYREVSDNSIASVSSQQYTDESLVFYANKIDKNALQLQMDFSGAKLPISVSESPRDLSEHLRNIDFFSLGDSLELAVQYDGELNDYAEQTYSYAKDEFFYDKMKGLFFIIETPSIGFDRLRDFGRTAGLNDTEITALYWTPATDNYLILKSRQLQKYSYGNESYEGMADIYDLICFDEKDNVVSVKQKYVFDDENAYLAHFRNIETDPNYNMMFSHCVGITADENVTAENKNMSFTLFTSDAVNKMNVSGENKASIFSKVSADTQVVENVSGTVGE